MWTACIEHVQVCSVTVNADEAIAVRVLGSCESLKHVMCWCCSSEIQDKYDVTERILHGLVSMCMCVTICHRMEPG